MWVARDKSGQLHLWKLKPVRYGRYYYSEDESCDNIWESEDEDKCDNWSLRLEDWQFSNLKWEDEPLKIESILDGDEEINDEELDKLAETEANNTIGEWRYDSTDLPKWYGFKEGFKAGYRKAQKNYDE